jgi:hypothetical protein
MGTRKHSGPRGLVRADSADAPTPPGTCGPACLRVGVTGFAGPDHICCRRQDWRLVLRGKTDVVSGYPLCVVCPLHNTH